MHPNSNNKFTAEMVTKIWKYIVKKLKIQGIEVICSATDGDRRFLKTMHLDD